MEEFDAIAESQGWNTSTLLSLALDFIEEHQDGEAFIQFLNEKTYQD